MTHDTPSAPLTAPNQAQLDRVLIAQLAVAWAGEDMRLGWWKTNMVEEFGGVDLLRRVAPSTWAWSVFQAAREAARRVDAKLRAQSHDADAVLTLFHLGVDLDEHVEARLQELKRSGQPPRQALPALAQILPEEYDDEDAWERETFAAWVSTHGDADFQDTPIGPKLRGALPDQPSALIRALIVGLGALPDAYPLPHARSAA